MSRTSHNHQLSRITPDRLCWRLPEWMKLTGTSRPTLWRQVKRGDLKLVYVGPMPMVPRSEAIRLGFIHE
jgi:predicted DNA-binding transcriptional regulator AlpA